MTGPNPTNRWRIDPSWTTKILVVSIGVWIGSLVAVMLSLHMQQKSAFLVASSDSSWNAFQISQESNKVQVLLTDSIVAPEGFAQNSLLMRVDVLISRITLLPGLDGMSMSSDDRQQIAPKLEAVRGLRPRLEALYDAIKTGDDFPARRRDLYELNRELQLKSQDLSLAVHLANSNAKAVEREAQQRLFMLIEAAVGGIVLSFAGILWLHIKKARRADKAYQDLLASERREAQSAEALKVHEHNKALLTRELEMARRVKAFSTTITAALAQIGSATKSLTATSGDVMQASGKIKGVVQETTAHFSSSSHRVGQVVEAGAALREASRVVSDSVDASRQLVEITAQKADQGHASVKSLVSAASQIADVAESIKGIADQTNLLALNATIEAARAGEAGRGFAVVAQEVKQLALQTSAATNQISDLILSIQAAGRSSLDLFDTLERGVTDIVAKNDRVTAAIAAQLRHVETINDITAVSAPATSKARAVYEDLNDTVAHIERVALHLSEVATSLDGRVRDIVRASQDLQSLRASGDAAAQSA
ncbi:MAG: methyl-accepting chemotaxis protein [Alsobacter sp.]